MKMKKLSYLAVAGLLAACAGGGNGGGGNPGGGNTPEDIRASNANITGMVSEIGVNQGNGSHANINLSRAATGTANIGGILYDTYRLDDVDFIASDEDFGMALKFSVDANGKIVGFSVINDPQGAPEEMPFSRNGDTANFSGQVKTDVLVDAVVAYNSLGKDMGLQFSDFGNISIAVLDDWKAVFIGGYDVKKIDPSAIASTSTFTGKATGGVMAIRGGDGSGKGLSLDANATLVFDPNSGNPKQTLTANFANWYDVKYEKVGNATGTVAFTNGGGISDADFRLIDDSTGAGKTVNATNEDFRYFGENGNPVEAVGIVQVRDCTGGNCNSSYDEHQEVRMNLGFGGKN
jgi:hypothetical protein